MFLASETAVPEAYLCLQLPVLCHAAALILWLIHKLLAHVDAARLRVHSAC
jgi:hypothetical protein